jgi:hypothetical protein
MFAHNARTEHLYYLRGLETDRQKFYTNYLSGLFIREYKIKKTAAKRSDGFACFI